MNIIEKARQYAISCHEETNHKYDGKPYDVHLQMVFNEAVNYILLVDERDRDNFLAAAWVHDVIEDCRQTYNDVLNATNKEVAELAYALTNEKGKSRAERANYKYYEGIKKCKHAVLLKLCDRIANFRYSIKNKSRMAEMYAKENVGFITSIYDKQYEAAFTDLRNLSVSAKTEC